MNIESENIQENIVEESTLLSEPECSTSDISSPSRNNIPETEKKITPVRKAANKKVETQLSASGKLMDYLLKIN